MLPFATTTVTVAQADPNAVDVDPLVDGRAQVVVAQGVRANINLGAPRVSFANGEKVVDGSKFQMDLVPGVRVATGATLTDESTGDVFEVVSAAQKDALGLGHIAGIVVAVTGRD